MSQAIYQKVRQNPKYAVLVAKRGRFALLLSAIVLLTYYAFMMVVAFNPSVIGTPLAEGATLSWGVPLGAIIIIGSWVLTAVYVSRANGEFDRLNEELIREASR